MLTKQLCKICTKKIAIKRRSYTYNIKSQKVKFVCTIDKYVQTLKLDSKKKRRFKLLTIVFDIKRGFSSCALRNCLFQLLLKGSLFYEL